jgi:hypothetical protein
MALMENKAALAKAAKDLVARWYEVKGVWSDAQSQEFENVYLLQFEQDVRAALGAMDHMSQVLQRIEYDCE